MYEQANKNPSEHKSIGIESLESWVPLSILAALTGATLMGVLITFFNISIETEHTTFTRIGVLVGLACIAASWVKIYWHRSNPRGFGQ